MMKKISITLAVMTLSIGFVSAQVLPSFQFGAKGGLNFSSISTSAAADFSSNNQSGYLAGFWARFGALGFNFQPEMYFASKTVDLYQTSGSDKATFHSIDVPLLFGGKVGALGLGGRFYTGPVVSFQIDKNQSFSGAAQNAIKLNYHDQNFAWQFGAGLDIQRVSVDVRYEAGITSQSVNNAQAKVNIFSLSLAYRLVKI